MTDWRALWTEALRLWGRYITVHEPTWCATTADARREGLTGSFAMFRVADRTVVLDLELLHRLGLDDYGLEVLAHEVGHHVLCPADLSDSARLLARIRDGLPGYERHAPMVANLYADMLINDRLFRSRGLRMDEMYARMGASGDPLWLLYLRGYEILWSLPARALTGMPVDAATDGDAQLAARLVRVYADDWQAGAGGFATLVYRYLAEVESPPWVCHGVIDAGAVVDGLAARDPTPIVHPALDPRVNDFAETPAEPAEPSGATGGSGQFREPFEYGQILRQLGMEISDEDAAARYYRERAAGQLVPFPVRRSPTVVDPIPEGHASWDVGEPLADVDWLATALRSPVVVPGITTLRQLHGDATGHDKQVAPVDLDLYVDSSGSMPDPRREVSYLTLAGAILALSALRVGARVQVTLWSGSRQFLVTDGFVRDEAAILRVLCGFFGGATAFPLHVLRDTYAERGKPTHIVVISDDGVDTMVQGADESGRPGAEIAATALAEAGAGGTLLLNLPASLADRYAAMFPGWDLHRVTDWSELVEFAREFGRRHYQRG